MAHGRGKLGGFVAALDEVVHGATAHRFQAHLGVVEAGKDDHRDVGEVGEDGVQGLQALGVGQAQVGEDEVDVAVLLGVRKSGGANGIHLRCGIDQVLLDEAPIGVDIFDDQEPNGCFCRHGDADHQPTHVGLQYKSVFHTWMK